MSMCTLPTKCGFAALGFARDFLADSDTDVDVRRHDEAERPPDRLQVESLDVEDVFQRVRLVGSNIGLKCILCAQVQEVVLRNKFFELKFEMVFFQNFLYVEL